MKKFMIIFGLFPLILLAVLMASQELKAQVIVPDFQVRGDSLYLESWNPEIAVDKKNNFSVIYNLFDQRPRFILSYILGHHYNENGIINKKSSYSTIGGTPVVAMNDSGYFIIAGGSSTARFQRFDSHYEALDTIQEVDRANLIADVDIANAGNFIIAWSYSDSIYCQRYDKEGEKVGNAILVNENIDGATASPPRIAEDSLCNFAVTWRQVKNYQYDIYCRLFDNNGEPRSENIKVNSDTSEIYKSKSYPDIGADPSGNIMIVWSDDRDGDYDVYCQRYTKSGIPLGDNLKVNNDSDTTDQKYPVISVSESGNFIVVWEDRRNGSSDIYAQRYDAGGTEIGNNFRINRDQAGDQGDPDVALKNGRIFTTWHLYYASSNNGIWANVLDFDNPTGVNFKEIKTQTPTDFRLNQNFPNPFNSTTTIEYELPQECFVICKIYNMLGQEIKTILSEEQSAGTKSIIWDGTDNVGAQVSTGIYILLIESNEFVKSHKMVLLR